MTKDPSGVLFWINYFQCLKVDVKMENMPNNE